MGGTVDSSGNAPAPGIMAMSVGKDAGRAEMEQQCPVQMQGDHSEPRTAMCPHVLMGARVFEMQLNRVLNLFLFGNV